MILRSVLAFLIITFLWAVSCYFVSWAILDIAPHLAGEEYGNSGMGIARVSLIITVPIYFLILIATLLAIQIISRKRRASKE